MSIFCFLFNRRKKWGVALLFFLATTVFGMQCSRCNGKYNGKRKKKKSAKCISLDRTSLEKAYTDLMAFNSSKIKKLSAREIIEYSKNAYEKKIEIQTQEEKIALRLVTSASVDLAKRIIKKASESKSNPATILIFGGILQGGGDFLKRMILGYIDKLKTSGYEYKIIFSKMGDERAILGAVKDAESKFNFYNNLDSKYAIGIDIGGTNIRVGLVDFKKYLIVGKLIKQPVFINEFDEKRMHFFRKQMAGILKGIEKNENYKPNGLSYFLKYESLKVEYELLTDLVINRICDLIKELKKDLKIKFVAISSAGIINNSGFCLGAHSLPFTCVDIKQRIENIIKVPVFVANDMDCAALGEKNFGALKSVNEFTIVGLGTGSKIKKFNFTD